MLNYETSNYHSGWDGNQSGVVFSLLPGGEFLALFWGYFNLWGGLLVDEN